MIIGGNISGIQYTSQINIVSKPEFIHVEAANQPPIAVTLDSEFTSDISEDGIRMLFESRLLTINRNEGNEIEAFAKRYAEISTDIEDHFENKNLYLEQLDAAFGEVIQEAAQTSATRVTSFLNKYLKTDEQGYVLNEAHYIDMYKGLANGLKELYQKDSTENAVDLFTKDYFANQPVFKSYSDFKLTIEIGNYSNDLRNSIISTASKVGQTNPKEIIGDSYQYNKLLNEMNQLVSGMDGWRGLLDKIDKSTLGDSLKTTMKDAYQRTTEHFEKASNNIGQYSKYLVEYKSLDEQLRKLQARYVQQNSRAEAYNKQKNIEQAGQALVKAAEIQGEISEIQGKKFDLEAKMSKIQLELNKQMEEM